MPFVTKVTMPLEWYCLGLKTPRLEDIPKGQWAETRRCPMTGNVYWLLCIPWGINRESDHG